MQRPIVLVAEADTRQRQLIDVMLSSGEVDAVLVASAQEALAYLKEHTPAALLLATNLPDIDGFALCQKVKAVGRLARTPVTLVADAGENGVLDERTRAMARTAGAELLLQRPLGDKNLRERILRLIDSPATDPGLTVVGIGDPTGRAGHEAAPSGVLAPNLILHGPHAQGGQVASELGGLRAEVAQLRGENVSLKTRLQKYRTLAEQLQAQLDEERKRPRGLFRRRS